MADTPQPKTQHDFNLAVVGAIGRIHAENVALGNRLSVLEDSEEKRAATEAVGSVSDALAFLAEAVPVSPPTTAAEAIALMKADGDADPEGSARLNYPALFTAPQPADA